MKNIKYMIKTGLASVALAAGVAFPAAAATQTTTCAGGLIATNICPNVNVNNSRNRSLTLGNGSAIIRNNVSQLQLVGASTTQGNVGVASGVGIGGAGTGTGVGILGAGTGVGAGGAGTGVGANSQSNSATTSATGTQSNTVNFAPSL